MSNDFETWLRGYVNELQDVDTAATDLLRLVTLEAATGVHLDGLGQIIGVERQGYEDDAYRSLLRAYIGVNTSGGTIEQLNQIIRLATNTTAADQAFSLVESTPAEFKIDYIPTLGNGLGPVAADAMYAAKAAGVYGVFEYHDTTPVFAFDGAGGSNFGTATSLPGNSGYYLKTAIRNRDARESEVL